MSASTDIPRGARRSRTYLPQPSDRDELLDFAELLRDLESHLARRGASKAALVDPHGAARPIPDDIFRILEQVTNALAAGQGITVIPQGTTMTTQQAADYLGISRPTLVRLLESGEIPFTTPGRHRRVLLQDLITYQERSRRERRGALRDLARTSLDSAVKVGDPTTVRRLTELDGK